MHNIVAGNNVLLLSAAPRDDCIREGFLRGHFSPLTKKVSQKMQIRTSSLINASSIFYLNDFFFYPGKMTCVALMRSYCWYWQFFSILFHINEGEDIREGKAFVSNCVVMILFSKQMTYKGMMQDTRWEMDHGSDKGSSFFFHRWQADWAKDPYRTKRPRA